MQVVSSTDRKYLGATLPSGLSVGDMVSFGDFEFMVQYKLTLENGNIVLGSPNYQLELEE